MQYEYITTADQLAELCARMRGAQRVAFDTEFVSEFTYRPDLCLIQVECDGSLAVIDPHQVPDVSPFWRQLADGGQQTIVHAGREEYRFCLAAAGRAPQRWFDVQLAAGMVGHEYPISYAKLLQRLVGVKSSKEETRTDWRHRPLTQHQIDYALQDVLHLPAMCELLQQELQRLERQAWFAAETQSWRSGHSESVQRERWRKVTGISSLSPRGLQIVRELWRWREQEAERRDIPSRRVMRDDLLVELARRGKSEEKQIRAVRGLHRRDLEDQYGAISAAIGRGLEAERAPRQKPPRSDYPAQINLLGQFLGTALHSICRRQAIAVSLVGTAQDVKDLIAYELGYSPDDPPPALITGWRKEIVGQRFERLLAGELALRIQDPHSNAPVVFDEKEGRSPC